jgi:hypothetical protein
MKHEHVVRQKQKVRLRRQKAPDGVTLLERRSLSGRSEGAGSLSELPQHATARPLRLQAALQAQAQLGNHQVQRMLKQNEQSLQRFESPEHQDIGDAHLESLYEYLQTRQGQAWAGRHGLPSDLAQQIAQDPVRQSGLDPRVRGKIFTTHSGVKLSVGDVIALMGDLYPTWQAILNAPANQLEAHLETMRLERHGQITSDEATQRYETDSEGAYLRLAQRNVTHFAPYNRAEWQRLHEEAKRKAQEAGNDRAAFNEALFVDAAAGHFLTDAFAAGHLFRKAEVEAAILTHLRANPIQVADPEMQIYISAAQAGGKLYQLVLKNIHDHLNTVGFEVTNGQGMTWTTYGDSSLHKDVAEKTRHIAALAVFLSRRQIYRAHQGEPTDVNEVLSLLPNEDSEKKATEAAIAYIPTAAQEVPALIMRNRGSSRVLLGDYLGRWVEAHLATIGMRNDAAARAGLGERFNQRASRNLIIPDSTSGTLRLGPVTFDLADFSSRREILNLRVPNMNVTAPIPGLEGLSGELDIRGSELTIGIHVDVGRFLPENWGFGPSLPIRLGDRSR